MADLTFTPTNTAAEFSVPITDDRVFEPSPEDFEAELTLVTVDPGVVIEPSLATVLITDDDSKSLLSLYKAFSPDFVLVQQYRLRHLNSPCTLCLRMTLVVSHCVLRLTWRSLSQ